MKKILLITATVLIVAFGVWEALWTDRFSLSNEPRIAADKMHLLPLTIGEWTGTKRELDPRGVARAEMTDYILRTYVNLKGESVQVLLVCGRSGPTALHPPDICYQNAGYSLDAPPVKHPMKGLSAKDNHEFWVARFKKSGPNVDPLRIFWAWTAAGTWTAPDNPRWTFGGQPFLYKLYVVRSLPSLNEPLEKDPALDFLKELLPELSKSLFTPATKAQSSVWLQPLPGTIQRGRWA